MQTITVPTSQVAQIAAKLGYRKKKVNIVATTKVTMHGLNWSGGSKSDYHAYGLNTGKLVSPNLGRPHPMDNKAEGATIAVPEGVIMARTGFFCGKVSTMTLYVNPANMPALLPEGGAQ
jgi:hypothetical protein